MKWFSELDTKEKIVIIGGGILVIFFLLKSIFNRGAADSNPSQAAADLSNQAAGLNQQYSDFQQQMQDMFAGYQDSTTKLVDEVNKLEEVNKDQSNQINDLISKMGKSTPTPPATAAAPAAAPAQSGPIGTGKVVTSSKPLNVRSGPGTSYSILKSLAKGTSWQVWATAKGADGYTWYNLGTENGHDQWVSGQYFKMN